MEWHKLVDEVIIDCITLSAYGFVGCITYYAVIRKDYRWFVPLFVVAFCAGMAWAISMQSLDALDDSDMERSAIGRMITTLIVGAVSWYAGSRFSRR